MSQALLKKFRRAKQGSSEQKEILRRAKNDLRRNKILGLKPSSALQTIVKEFKPETKKQLKEKADSAREGAALVVGGPLLKGAVKGVQLGRAALSGLPKGITKVRGGFKVGDKTYQTAAAAKGALTRQKNVRRGAGTSRKPPKDEGPGSRPVPSNKKYQQFADGTLRLIGGKPKLKTTTKVTKSAKDKTTTKVAPRNAGKSKSTSKVAPIRTRKQIAKDVAGAGATLTGITATAAAIGKDEKRPQAAEAAAAPKKEDRRRVTNKRDKTNVKERRVTTKPRSASDLELIPKGAEPKKRATYDASAGRTSRGNKGYETMREYFVEDLTPRKSKVKTPLGIIDIDTKEDMDEETRDILEMAQKKGGRLRKGKIKTSTRKRAALRGHRAELRGG